MKRLRYIYLMMFLLAAFNVAGMKYEIDKVCVNAIRQYRIEGETGSTYLWLLNDSAGNPVTLSNPTGTPFTNGVIEGSEINIHWTKTGNYKLAAVQYSSLGCDTIEQGEIFVFDPPLAFAGNPISICSGSGAMISGSTANNYSSLLWTSTGDGSFDDPTILHPTYTPGFADMAGTKIKLTIKATGLGSNVTCNPYTSSVDVTIIKLGADISGTDVKCMGEKQGTATVTAFGGIYPYTYIWDDPAKQTSDIATGLVAGTYHVTVSDLGNCSIVKEITINEPPTALFVAATGTDLKCIGGNDGTATVTISGGNPPYTVVWDDPALQKTTTVTGLTAGTYHVFVTDANGCSANTTVKINNPVLPLTASVTKIDATCFEGNDGTATVNTVNGNGPFIYLWDDPAAQKTKTAAGLTIGTYNVLVTDVNGCTATAQVTIDAKFQVLLSETHVPTKCNGALTGSIDLSVTGGMGPYNYSWSNGSKLEDISSLGMGLYTVKVTDQNGCSASLSVSIPENSFELTETHVVAGCYGTAIGSIDLTVTDGTPPFSYKWSNGAITQDISGLAPGNYVVTVIDAAACKKFMSIDIVEPLPLTIAENHVNIGCNGVVSGSIKLTVSGGTQPYVYLWSNGSTNKDVSGLIAGSYTVTVIDKNGCTDSETITIEKTTPLVLTESVQNLLCSGSFSGSINLSLSGGVPPYEFLWNDGIISEDRSSLAAGKYTVTVTDFKKCQISKSFNVIEPSPISILVKQVDLGFNTMPVGEIDLTVSGGVGPYLFDWSTGETTEDISGLAAGVYTVTVTDQNGCKKEATINITQQINDLTVNIDITIASCPGGNDATAMAIPSGGTSPYKYSWNNGEKTQTINGLIAKIYSVTVTDFDGLSRTAIVTIPETPLKYTIQSVTPNDPVCKGGNGKIEFIFTSIPNDYYDILYDGGQFSMIDISGNRATVAAPAGTYNNLKLVVRGCTTPGVFNVTLIDADELIIAAGVTAQPSCYFPTGTIEAISPIGVNYNYSLDGEAYQVSGKFPGLIPGSFHTIKVMDVLTGCESKPFPLKIDPKPINPKTPTVLISKKPNCYIPFGTIEVTSPIDVIYQYSIDGGAYQASTIFANLNPLSSHTVTVMDVVTGCESLGNTISIGPLPLNPIIPEAKVIVNPSCKNIGGTVEITKPLGSDFEYSINGAPFQKSVFFPNLVTNTYNVLVRSKTTGCESTGIVVVPGIPPSPVLKFVSKEDIVCYGDSGTINLEFVNAPDNSYTITYTGGQFNKVKVAGNKASIRAVAGIYNHLTINVNDCLSNELVDVQIIQPAQIVINAIVTQLDYKTKALGSIGLTVNGGTGPYSFAWSNSETTKDINNLIQGTYKVIVTDSVGCKAQKTFTILKLNYPPIAKDDKFDAGCSGVTGNLILNDYDPENDKFFIDTVLVIRPVHGALTLNEDGSFEYLAYTGYSGPDVFKYAIYDGVHYLGDTASVTITIVADFDCDGIQDTMDPDADGDGILNVDEGDLTADFDGDGHPNWLDIDADNDGIVDNFEGQNTFDYIAPKGIDTDHDGIDDAYDTDNGGSRIFPVDTDGDGKPDFLDTDSDNDLVPDYIEGHDMNADGKPDHVFIGKDSDSDGLVNNYDTVDRYKSPYENMTGSNAAMQDFDGDGMKDWRDENDDDDKYLTRFEDLNADGDFSNDDTDHDGHPEYLDYGRECDLFIPDAFSPNDDNIHDYFQIYCMEHFPNAKMYIFDQLGNKLFEKEHYGNLEFWGSHDRAWWDGRTTNRAATSTSGGKVSPGTYYYVINLGNGEIKKSFVFVSY